MRPVAVRSSVALRPHDALLARLPRERARAGLASDAEAAVGAIDERDAAHGDLEVILDLRLERGIAVEVGRCFGGSAKNA
jgi:hypothetical protein